MRLKVNGVAVRVVDRIEIEIDVARDGEVLLNGIQVRVRGGGLTIIQGASPDAAFRMHVDRTLQIKGKDNGAMFVNEDTRAREHFSPYLPFLIDPGAGKLTCDEGDPAISCEADGSAG